MKTDGQGELRPRPAGRCADGCSACGAVCPFLIGASSIERLARHRYGRVAGIRSSADLGYHLAAFRGRTLDRREGKSSGGLASWTLQALLRRGDVDAVICASANGAAPGRLHIFGPGDDMTRTPGPRYLPLDISEALRTVLHGPDRRYAVIGLPCYLHAIRLAAEQHPVLASRVQFLLGLVCNFAPGMFYTDALLALLGAPAAESVDYRHPIPGPNGGSTHGFRASRADGTSTPALPFDGVASFLWSNGFFSPTACHFCDDVFGETADATFMDALTPGTRQAPTESLCLIRDPHLASVLRSGASGGALALDAIDPAHLCQSQDATVVYKKQLIGARRAEARRQGLTVMPPRCLEDPPPVAPDPATLARLRRSRRSKRWWRRLRALGAPALWLTVALTCLSEGRRLGSVRGWRALARSFLMIAGRRMARSNSP